MPVHERPLLQEVYDVNFKWILVLCGHFVAAALSLNNVNCDEEISITSEEVEVIKSAR